MRKPLTICGAMIRLYSDTGQVQAQIAWSDGSTTVGSPRNWHMQALLTRATRDGLTVAKEKW